MPDAALGTALAAAAGSVDAAGIAKWSAIAVVFNANVKLADLKPGAVNVPISGPVGVTAAVGVAVLQ